MARIRTIKPEFPQSESMGRVSRDARLCFVMLWTIADDEGRLRGSPRMLASLLFPYDNDAPQLVDHWLGELEREDCVVRYAVDGHQYVGIRNWLNHQKIDKPTPSRLPSFEDFPRALANPREDSSLDLGPRKGMERKGKEDCGMAGKRPMPPASVEASPFDFSQVAFPEFPCVPGRSHGPPLWLLTEAFIAELASAYPAVDVPAESRRAHVWVKANLERRKTAKGMAAFLNRWMARAQDRGARRSAWSGSSPPTSPGPLNTFAPRERRPT